MVENGSVTGKNMFFQVDEMSEGAQEVHGMSLEDLEQLSGGERFEDRVEEIFAGASQNAAAFTQSWNFTGGTAYVRFAAHQWEKNLALSQQRPLARLHPQRLPGGQRSAVPRPGLDC